MYTISKIFEFYRKNENLFQQEVNIKFEIFRFYPNQ